jgi:hypothetical protein
LAARDEVNQELAGSASRYLLSGEQARESATDAYIYGYPLLIMDVSATQMTNLPTHQEIGSSTSPTTLCHQMGAALLGECDQRPAGFDATGELSGGWPGVTQVGVGRERGRQRDG